MYANPAKAVTHRRLLRGVHLHIVQGGFFEVQSWGFLGGKQTVAAAFGAETGYTTDRAAVEFSCAYMYLSSPQSTSSSSAAAAVILNELW